MERKITLSDTNLLKVRDETANCEHCGSNQEWFADEWQRKAGCGPSTAANILYYQQRKSQESVHYSKEEMLLLMEEVWEYITPGWDGISSTEVFLSKVRRYAVAHGLELDCYSLDISKRKSKRPPLEKVIDFVVDGIYDETPVAFLNLSNGEEQALDSWHWVTVVGLRFALEEGYAIATICDEGKVKEIDLALWLNTTALGGGFAYFLLHRDPASVE